MRIQTVLKNRHQALCFKRKQIIETEPIKTRPLWRWNEVVELNVA